MKFRKVHPPSSDYGATSSRKPIRIRQVGGRQPSAFSLQPLALGPQRGVALVVTLIMLSIITFLAVAFLVLSQRENASATTAMDQKTAHMASDAAFNRVCVELLADGLVKTNFQTFDMKVSTNYYSYSGFNNTATALNNPTNVNYDHEINGQPYLGGAVELQRNISDLEFNPRAPVFVQTNSGSSATDFRFYLDLNQNGKFETNGLLPVIVADSTIPGGFGYTTTNASGQFINVPLVPQPAWILSNNFVGDPEWIGVLERPRELHSADNKFVARYAYLVVPAGNTLDINYIHNRAKRLTLQGEGFYRNQGVGTYEGNLAGFLADLNTNMWWYNNGFGDHVYNYNTAPNFSSTGVAFTNANDLLSYRYGGPTATGWGTLNAPPQLFSNNALAFASANIDIYAKGPLMLGNNTNIPYSVVPWSGADNTQHVFSVQDFFDAGKLAGSSFPNNLQVLGTSNDSYNAYTYYRLLSQLGSDSAPEQYKLNINWKNTDIHGNIVPGMETNQIAWTPLDFFTNAADRMFRQLDMHDLNNNLITITNIPFYEDPKVYNGTNINYYTPAVHRILQVAANIYDATTKRYLPSVNSGPTNYPSVFRPIFKNQSGIGSIVGFLEVTNSADAFMAFSDASNFVANAPVGINNPFVNIYGVGWVIGAKKGFPTFNEMSLDNPVMVTRKLQFTNSAAKPPWTTNQLFDFSVTNSFGIEAWNSYTNSYGRPLRLVVSNIVSINLTDRVTGAELLDVNNRAYGNDITYPTGWPGWSGNVRSGDASYKVPLMASDNFTNATYTQTGIFPVSPTVWSATVLPPIFYGFTFKLTYILIDTSVTPNRVVDFVNVVGTRPALDVSTWLGRKAAERVEIGGNVSPNDMWATNFSKGSLIGVLNQIYASASSSVPTDWAKDQNRTKETQDFVANIGGNTGRTSFEAPYSPEQPLFIRLDWEANDPQVHYTSSDLTSTNGKMALRNGVYDAAATPPMDNLTNLNYAYQPWGGYPAGGNASQQGYDYNYQVKDASIYQSDNWDFPTNKFWDIGILGRVHRGTPWQTINLKPFNPFVNNWTNWVNDNAVIPRGNFVLSDGFFSTPNLDYQLFDLFTCAPNANSTRGQLNINQTGLAAWSAILSGVNVIANTPGGPVPMAISPAGTYDTNNPTPIARIVQGINATRNSTNQFGLSIFKNKAFQSLGDILNVPELTTNSPFIDTNGFNPQAVQDGIAGPITDEELERIPQQVMSLLTLNQNPRFVIYSFGQTLHPANNSLVVGGTFNGLCTNYQITAEIATRAVVRVDGSPDPKFTRNNPDPQGRFYPPHIVVEQFNVLGP